MTIYKLAAKAPAAPKRAAAPMAAVWYGAPADEEVDVTVWPAELVVVTTTPEAPEALLEIEEARLLTEEEIELPRLLSAADTEESLEESDEAAEPVAVAASEEREARSDAIDDASDDVLEAASDESEDVLEETADEIELERELAPLARDDARELGAPVAVLRAPEMPDERELATPCPATEVARAKMATFLNCIFVVV